MQKKEVSWCGARYKLLPKSCLWKCKTLPHSKVLLWEKQWGSDSSLLGFYLVMTPVTPSLWPFVLSTLDRIITTTLSWVLFLPSTSCCSCFFSPSPQKLCFTDNPDSLLVFLPRSSLSWLLRQELSVFNKRCFAHWLLCMEIHVTEKLRLSPLGHFPVTKLKPASFRWLTMVSLVTRRLSSMWSLQKAYLQQGNEQDQKGAQRTS